MNVRGDIIVTMSECDQIKFYCSYYKMNKYTKLDVESCMSGFNSKILIVREQQQRKLLFHSVPSERNTTNYTDMLSATKWSVNFVSHLGKPKSSKIIS